jgi:hypothetical protein
VLVARRADQDNLRRTGISQLNHAASSLRSSAA